MVSYFFEPSPTSIQLSLARCPFLFRFIRRCFLASFCRSKKRVDDVVVTVDQLPPGPANLNRREATTDERLVT